MSSDNYQIAVIHNLEGLFENKKIYRDTNLTALKLSILVGCSQGYLSQLIQKKFGVRISKLICQYRIRHAIYLIEEGYLSKYTVESLASDSGFSSRNTFYLAFKKETGLSPSAFVDSVVDLEWIGSLKI